MPTFNVKSGQKLCAFCKYWNDPANSAISPKLHAVGIWEYDKKAEAVCVKRGCKRSGYLVGCNDYECKIPR